jgi:ABC-type sugar transport system ATPase subunit/ribose/xylose/arabinose/galactoside ABC-type transport system permease subunit
VAKQLKCKAVEALRNWRVIHRGMCDAQTRHNIDAEKTLLSLRGIRKTFPGVVALDGVDFDIRRGEVHAVVGENGAGKSTLIKIIAGAYQPDEGKIIWEGNEVKLRNPNEALSLGIATIYQEPMLCPDLSVAENIFLSMLSKTFRVISWREINRRVNSLLEEVGISLPLNSPVSQLSQAQRQMVEIAKALLRDSKLLIMDEPTSSLSEAEIERLFDVVIKLKRRGVGIIYISHRIEEVFRLADRVTVLRDGKHVGTFDVKDVDEESLIQLMVGRPIDQYYWRAPAKRGDVLLQVTGLRMRGRFSDISFVVHSGEVVGMAGLVGSGRSSVAQAIFGILRPDGGEIVFCGEKVEIKSPADAIRLGIVYVPEDRLKQGIIGQMSVRENLTLAVLRQLSKAYITSTRREEDASRAMVESLRIHPPDLKRMVKFLSGGNQQKVVLGKWLLCRPKLLILDEPTRGIDVGAKAEVHKLIGELAKSGVGILLISSELPELLAMSDRVLVMRDGRIVGEMSRSEATQEKVISLAIGVDGKERMKTASEKQPAQRSKRSTLIRGVFNLLLSGKREQTLLISLIAISLLTALKRPDFLSLSNISDILTNYAYSLLVAIGMTCVIISGGIDLSVGALLALCSIVCGVLAKSGLMLGLIALISLSLGALCGLVNGALSVYLSIPPVIVTLGMMSIIRGGVLWATGGYWVLDLPQWFNSPYQLKFLQLPLPVHVALVIVILSSLALRYTVFGRSIYAVGSNPEAARLSGINVALTKCMSFVICGALTGVGAWLYATRFTAIQSNAGIGLELFVIASAVIGGTNIFGGSGNIIGSSLAIVLLGTIANALVFLHVSSYWENAIEGILILLAVGLDVVRWRIRQRGGT